MKITIITATCNSCRTIRDTIESVLKQTHPDIEYIIKDGGSHDRTLSICHEFEPLFNGKMKIITGPDKGLYDAINIGVKAASGDIVGILNSDDFFHRNDILGTISRVFEEDDSLEGIYGDAIVVAENDLNKTVRYTRAKHFKPWMFKIGLMPPHPSFYARKECFEEYGYYNPSFKIAADFDLMTRFMLIKKIKTAYLPLPVLTMRDGGMSTSIANKKLLNREQVTSWRDNGIKQPSWFLFFKYPVKLLELFANKDRK